MPEQLEMKFAHVRRERGELKSMLLMLVGDDWVSVRELSERTGESRQNIHSSLLRCSELEIRSARGRGKSSVVRRRPSQTNQQRLHSLMKPVRLN